MVDSIARVRKGFHCQITASLVTVGTLAYMATSVSAGCLSIGTYTISMISWMLPQWDVYFNPFTGTDAIYGVELTP